MPFLIIRNDNGQPALVYGAGLVTGIDGDSFAAFDAAFGPAIRVPPEVFEDFAAKGGR